jgi:hypothetical protein
MFLTGAISLLCGRCGKTAIGSARCETISRAVRALSLQDVPITGTS